MSVVQVAYGFRPLPNNSVNVVHPRVSSPSVSPVRRRLFADNEDSNGSDHHHHQVHHNHMMVLERQLAIIQREQSVKYNFDFHAEVPLPGRYVWERPSHPLPPPGASKRPLDQEDNEKGLPSAKRASQSKITGKNT